VALHHPDLEGLASAGDDTAQWPAFLRADAKWLFHEDMLARLQSFRRDRDMLRIADGYQDGIDLVVCKDIADISVDTVDPIATADPLGYLATCIADSDELAPRASG
jgi:hypothetical protein